MNEAAIKVQLLGGFALSVGDSEIPDGAWRLRKSKSLIKLLALAPEHRVHRDRVCELLWPERDASAATNNLHQALHGARRAIDAGRKGAGAALVLHDETLAFADPSPWIDSDAFELACAAARAVGTPEALRDAIDRYGGELLPEDRYEDWTVARRESLRELHLGLMLDLSELYADEENDSGAIELLHDAVTRAPLHEEAHRRLMRAYAEQGRRQAALAQYAQLRNALRSELEADPDAQTRELYQAILADRFEPAARRKRTPAESGGAAPQELQHNLPHLLTTFVGRDRELADVRGLVERSRMVTLTGPGGSGKTRLSIEAALGMLESFADGARLIELAGVGSPALVAPQAAAVFGIDVRSDRDPVEVLIRHLQERETLILLDNCEHLLEPCADFAERVLAACPRVRILATSREPLRIQGEVAWRVPSLSLPDRELRTMRELEPYAAIQLFCDRADAGSSDFEFTDGNAGAIADICFGLDGMPLAIELAAARTRGLAIEQIVDRLGDALDLLSDGRRGGLTRQQTLAATILWSHDLLDDRERVLFRRLGVFAGSFNLAAVEAVCTDDEPGGDNIADLLARLVEKSLVVAEDSSHGRRYRLLETIKQFARQRLAAAGEQNVFAGRLSRWSLEFAALHNPNQATGYVAFDSDAVEIEHDNLRAALAWTLAHEPDSALQLAASLAQFWMVCSHFTEGARSLGDALTVSRGPSALRARALHAACGLDVRLGNPDHLTSNMAEAVDIYEQIAGLEDLPGAMQQLGVMQWLRSELFDAQSTLDRAIELAGEMNLPAVIATARHAQSLIAYSHANYPAAREALSDSVTLLRRIEPDAKPAHWVVTQGIHAVKDASSRQFRLFMEETVLHFRRVDNRAAIAYVLCDLANVERADANFGSAAEALDEALAMFRRLDDPHGEALALSALGNLERTRGDIDAARSSLEASLALRRNLGDRRAIGMTISNLGVLAARAGDQDGARALLGRFLQMSARSDDEPAESCGLLNLANVELDAGEFELALELLDEATARLSAQRLVRASAWGRLAQLEAILAVGRDERADACAAAARAELIYLGDAQGLERLTALEARIGGQEAAKGELSRR